MMGLSGACSDRNVNCARLQAADIRHEQLITQKQTSDYGCTERVLYYILILPLRVPQNTNSAKNPPKTLL